MLTPHWWKKNKYLGRQLHHNGDTPYKEKKNELETQSVFPYSLSMADNGKFTIAQAVAKIVINTLTKQDFVNVICARASHWDEVGK